MALLTESSRIMWKEAELANHQCPVFVDIPNQSAVVGPGQNFSPPQNSFQYFYIFKKKLKESINFMVLDQNTDVKN